MLTPPAVVRSRPRSKPGGTSSPVRRSGARQRGDGPVEHGQAGRPADRVHRDPDGDPLPSAVVQVVSPATGSRGWSGAEPTGGGARGRPASLKQPGLVAGPGAAGQHEQGESEAERHGAHA